MACQKSMTVTMCGDVMIQMSMGYWPQQVARELHTVLGYKHELVDMEHSQIGAYLQAALREVPLEELIEPNSKSI